MEPVYVPKATLSYAVTVEVAYNAFDGKTLDEIALSIQDEILDMLLDVTQVTYVTTDNTALYFNDDEH